MIRAESYFGTCELQEDGGTDIYRWLGVHSTTSRGANPAPVQTAQGCILRSTPTAISKSPLRMARREWTDSGCEIITLVPRDR